VVKKVVALEHVRCMRGGTQAHLMRCSDGGYYVVKFQNNPQGVRILANEMLGGALAARLGLPTPEIAIVEVRDSLIAGTKELIIQVGRGRVACSPGLCFGSRHSSETDPFGRQLMLPAYDFLPPDVLGRVSNLVDFAGMLVFDKWTCNTDGRQVVFVRDQGELEYRVVMIDNGFCFNAGEWNFPDAPLRGLYGHSCAYAAIEGIESFRPWLQLLESKIDKLWLTQIADEIPRDWYSQRPNRLYALMDQLERRRLLVVELLRSTWARSPRHFQNWVGRPGLIHAEGLRRDLLLFKSRGA
jgi:hypothetical protein